MALTYHPKLPSVSTIISKHWRTLQKDQKAKEIFPLPPMVAFKQPANLRNKLVRAKLPTQGREKRQVMGIKPCNKPCGICPYVLKSSEFISTGTKERFQILMEKMIKQQPIFFCNIFQSLSRSSSGFGMFDFLKISI